MVFIELSHLLKDGMMTYPGLPEPRFGVFLGRQESREHYNGQAEFLVGSVEMVGSTGTYIDSPFHRFKDGLDLGRIELSRLAGLDGVVVDGVTRKDRSITIENPAGGYNGKAVLVRTDWDKRWGSESYWELCPYLSSSLVDQLVSEGAALVGVDFWNVDNTEDPSRPVHTKLLKSEILIVENMCNLEKLPLTGFRFYAVPLRISGGASFPVRAFAEV
jgi:kynurenine formamidase